MNSKRCGLFLLGLGMLAAIGFRAEGVARADSQQGDTAGAAPVATENESDGLWPTRTLVRSLVRRWALDMAETYDLSREQHEQLESRMLDRWPAFLDENRSKLQPLVNEYLELRMGVEPPTSDQVAGWAARAIPALDQIRAEIEEAQRDTVDLLDANQRQQFEVQRGKLVGGMAVAEGVLRQWSVGSFRINDVWDEPKGAKRYAEVDPGEEAPADELDRNGAADPEESPYPARLAEELHEWEVYVAAFCDRYEFDRSQRNAAESILREMLARAADHARLNRERILAMERAFEDPASRDLDEFDKEFEEVYGPIDELFRELDERIHRLPTEGQNRKVQIEEGYDGVYLDQNKMLQVSPSVRQNRTTIQPATTQPNQP